MMYVGRMFSETMEWVSLGRTKEEAKEAILAKWNENQERIMECDHGFAGHFFEDVEALEMEYDIVIFEVAVGDCAVM